MSAGERGLRLRRARVGLTPLLLVAAGAFAFASPARALDGLRKRITPDFGEVPCMQRVALDEVGEYHFDWSLEEEASYPLGEFEAEQGQRFQFLAIDRQTAGNLPEWINEADIDEAQALSMLDASAPELGEPEDEAVWERSALWPSGSWLPITPDDERILQTFEAAQMGVTWQLDGVSPGAYQIVGYTWDPNVNVNTPRDGLLKLVASADDIGAPALFVRPFADTPTIAEGEHLDLSLCVDAAPESTLEGYIARPNPNARSNDDFDWVPVKLSSAPVTGPQDLEVQLEVPELGVGSTFQIHRVRIDIVSPAGERYTAIAPRTFNVSQGDGAPPPVGDETGEDGGASAGGGCRISVGASSLWWLFALFGLRRRPT